MWIAAEAAGCTGLTKSPVKMGRMRARLSGKRALPRLVRYCIRFVTQLCGILFIKVVTLGDSRAGLAGWVLVPCRCAARLQTLCALHVTGNRARNRVCL